MAKKVELGQFFTVDELWLKPQVVEFIKSSNCNILYDPFAGGGHLLSNTAKLGNFEVKGLDIDRNLGWEYNDSLENIPHVENAIIITNPPYLTNYSAARKGVYESVSRYFDNSNYDDLYLIALERMLEAQQYVVAIIPETFINSNFKKKNFLKSITILEDNPFFDTDTPVVVACFDGVEKQLEQIDVYKNTEKILNFEEVENLRIYPENDVEIKFNVMEGWLGARCVDSTDPNNKIKFDFKDKIDYDWEKGIKESSRLLTLIDIDVKESDRPEFIKHCNKILSDLRTASYDTILSPFKGNAKNGVRRRRLDFMTCRAILEQAYNQLKKGKEMNDNKYYFEYSKQNPEPLIDPIYAKKSLVISKDSAETSALIEKNGQLLEQISMFKELREQGGDKDSEEIIQVVSAVINLLDGTTNINYSPFAQFFMVYNATYNEYKKYKPEIKKEFIYEMLDHYVKERHSMYLSHGYSNVVLQVMCDNYSHKRNSKATISKILELLKNCSLERISNVNQLDGDNYYFLPDKGDKVLFNQFLDYYNLKMESREQNKYPDIVFKFKGQTYICELKTMKGSGGGQNKQMAELIKFVKYSEQNDKFHYIAFMDGNYPNKLLDSQYNNKNNKISVQYAELSKALETNPQNYFMNTAGFKKFVEDIIA